MPTQNQIKTSRPDFLKASLRATLMLLLLASAVQAIPLAAYHRQIKQAVTALDTLAQTDETETAADYAKREDETIDAVRTLYHERKPWNGTAHRSVWTMRGCTRNSTNIGR